jgi:hypothetical protein
MFIQVKPSS